jgi:hypothetical protein
MADSQPADSRTPRPGLFAQLRSLLELRTYIKHVEKRLDARLVKHGELLKILKAQQNEMMELIGPRGLELRLRNIERATHSLLRAQHLAGRDLPMPQALLARRFGVLSQNDEDGILLALFDRIGTTNCRFVTIGSGTNGGNAGMLAHDCGWSGLMVDASASRIERIRDRFRQSPVVACTSWITRENVNDLLREHGLTGEIDLLDIDIDGIDYWVWQSIEAVSPRVVVVEYNVSFGFERAITVPYDARFDRHRTAEYRYYGASLRAFERLGSQRGYRLVAIEPRGVNAFFVRQDAVNGLPALALSSASRNLKDETSLFESCERLHLPLVEV